MPMFSARCLSNVSQKSWIQVNMCGIWALFGCDSCKDLEKLLPSMFRLRHRGPDAFSMLSIGRFYNCVLGFVRLSIMDPLHGMQPIKLKQFEHLFMVFNGEIYNFQSLRQQFGFDFETNCDTEIILRLYAKGGIDFCVKHLYGVFAFILADVKEHKIYYARDTLGVRPLFVLEHKNQTSEEMKITAAASEVKGLVAIRDSCEPGQTQILPHPPGSFTEFNLLPNGSSQFVRCEKFHLIGALPVYEVSIPLESCTVYERVKHALTNAVDVRMAAERNIGCLLSGGLDSSLVCALVKQLMSKWGYDYELETFSIGMDKNSTDLKAAQKVANHLGTKHHSIVKSVGEFLAAVPHVVTQIETYDVTTIRASVGMYLVAQYIKEQSECKVILSGEGADELCQGYIYFHKAPSEEEGDAESRRLLEDLHYFDVLRADRTIAAHGLELRVPFLDHFMIHTYLSLDNKDKRPINNVEKYTLRKAFDGLGLLPDEILWRPKEAFSDGVSSLERPWFEVLQDHIETKISDEQMANAASLYPHNTPQTKESLFYRQIYEQDYPGLEHLIPYIWLPKWCGVQNNPSARVLSHFQA